MSAANVKGWTLALAAALLLAGCEERGQTPQEMADAAKACREGGFEVDVFRYFYGNGTFVKCGAYVGTGETP